MGWESDPLSAGHHLAGAAVCAISCSFKPWVSSRSAACEQGVRRATESPAAVVPVDPHQHRTRTPCCRRRSRLAATWPFQLAAFNLRTRARFRLEKMHDGHFVEKRPAGTQRPRVLSRKANLHSWSLSPDGSTRRCARSYASFHLSDMGGNGPAWAWPLEAASHVSRRARHGP